MRKTSITYVCDICGKYMGTEYWSKLETHSEVIWGPNCTEGSYHFCKDCDLELSLEIKKRVQKNTQRVKERTE